MSDLDIFIALYQNNYDALVRYTRAFVNSRSEAEDVLQNVMLHYAECPERVVEKTNRWGFLLKSLRNEAFDLRRAQKRVSPMDPALVNIISDEQYFEEGFDEFESYTSLLACLKQYPALIQEAFIDYVLYDYSINDLAARLGMKPNTLTKQFGRMAKALGKKKVFFSKTLFCMIVKIIVLFGRF